MNVVLMCRLCRFRRLFVNARAYGGEPGNLHNLRIPCAATAHVRVGWWGTTNAAVVLASMAFVALVMNTVTLLGGTS